MNIYLKFTALTTILVHVQSDSTHKAPIQVPGELFRPSVQSIHSYQIAKLRYGFRLGQAESFFSEMENKIFKNLIVKHSVKKNLVYALSFLPSKNFEPMTPSDSTIKLPDKRLVLGDVHGLSESKKVHPEETSLTEGLPKKLDMSSFVLSQGRNTAVFILLKKNSHIRFESRVATEGAEDLWFKDNSSEDGYRVSEIKLGGLSLKNQTVLFDPATNFITAPQNAWTAINSSYEKALNAERVPTGINNLYFVFDCKSDGSISKKYPIGPKKITLPIKSNSDGKTFNNESCSFQMEFRNDWNDVWTFGALYLQGSELTFDLKTGNIKVERLRSGSLRKITKVK